MQTAIECEIQESILDVVHPYGVTASDVFRYRRSMPGSMADCIERLKRTSAAANLVGEGEARIRGEGPQVREADGAHTVVRDRSIIGAREGSHIVAHQGVHTSEGAHIGGGDRLSLQEDDLDYERQRENEEKTFGSFADPPPPSIQTTSRSLRPAPPPPPMSGTRYDPNLLGEVTSREIAVDIQTRPEEPEIIEGGVHYGFPSTDRWNDGNAKKKPTVSPSKVPLPTVWGVEMAETDVAASQRSFDRTAGSDRSQYLSTFKRESTDDRPGRWVTGIHSEASLSDVTIDGASGTGDRYDTGRLHGLDTRRIGTSEGLIGRGILPMNVNKDEEMAAMFINLAPSQLADSKVREQFLPRRTGVPAESFSGKPSGTPAYDPSYVQIEQVNRGDSMRSALTTSRLPGNLKPALQHQPFSDSSQSTSRPQRPQSQQSVNHMMRTSDLPAPDQRLATRQEQTESPPEYRRTEQLIGRSGIQAEQLIGRSGIQAGYLPPAPTDAVYSAVRRSEKTSAGHTAAGAGQGRAHWTCRRCTLVNEPQESECVVCHSTKLTKL